MTTLSLRKPITIFENFYNLLNARDVESAMALVADEALFANASGQFAGKGQIQSFLQRLADMGHQFKFSQVQEANGRVTMAYQVFRDGNMMDEGTDGLTIIKDGKIVFDGLERTEKQ